MLQEKNTLEDTLEYLQSLTSSKIVLFLETLREIERRSVMQREAPLTFLSVSRNVFQIVIISDNSSLCSQKYYFEHKNF